LAALAFQNLAQKLDPDAAPDATQTVVVKVVYEDPFGEGPLEGPEYVYYLRDDGPAWRADAC
jgi:hypothetical protein